MNLKKIVTPIVLILFIVLNASTDFNLYGDTKTPKTPTGKDIFDKTLAALGGIEKTSTVKTLKYTMETLRYLENGSGTEIMKCIAVIVYPDKYWYQSEAMGYIALITTNGQKGWQRLIQANDPNANVPYVVLPERDTKDLQNYNLRDLFYISQNLDKYTFTFNGEKDFEGKKTFELLVNGLYKFQLFIDPQTYLPAGMIYWATSQADPESIENKEIYSDYKAVEGILIPFKQDLFAKGKKWAEVTIKDLKFNVEVSADFFDGK